MLYYIAASRSCCSLNHHHRLLIYSRIYYHRRHPFGRSQFAPTPSVLSVVVVVVVVVAAHLAGQLAVGPPSQLSALSQLLLLSALKAALEAAAAAND